MLRKNILKVENYFEVFLIVSLMILFFYLIWSFIIPIFLAATIVFLVHRPYNALVSRTKNKVVPALFMMFLVFALVLLPSYIIGISLVKQTSSLIVNGGEIINNLDLNHCTYSFCSTLKNNLKYLNFNLESFIYKIGNYLSTSVYSIFDSVSKLFINIFVFILAFYFLLVDGDKFMRYVKRIIPMKEDYKNSLFLRFRDVSKAVFVDSIFVSIVQGFLVGIGFYFAGFQSSVFWGTIAAFFALIPIVGTTIIWVPGVIYLFVLGDPLIAIILTIYCMFVVGLSDNVLRALLLNKKMHIHPFLVLLAVLGGLEVFGFFGIFLGPIIVSLLITVLQLYKLDLNKW